MEVGDMQTTDEVLASPRGRPRLLIVDSQPVFRMGLRKLLEQDVEVVGEASTVEEAVAQAARIAPEVILVDPDLGLSEGIEVIRALARISPSSRQVVLGGSAEGGRVAAAIHAGACGYVLKEASRESILNCVSAAAAGELFIPADVAGDLLDWMRGSPAGAVAHNDHVELTSRELAVLRLIAQGKDNSEIARELFLSRGTVKNHTSRIFEKLETENRVQAAVYAVLRGIL
jgi:two-component system, NarL family, response regulator LiaR